MAGSGRYSSGTEASPAASEPEVGGRESITKTVEMGSLTSHAGSEPMGFGSDLPGPLKLSENQITPPLKMAAPHSLAYFRSKRPPPKNATTARIQLAAIGRAALWQG